MAELKKIAIKILILVIILVGLNYLYKISLYKRDQIKYSEFSQKIQDAQDADVLYLGDCSDAYFGENPENDKGISELLDSLLPDKKVVGISGQGYHSGIYLALLKYIPENSKINTVVVTLNLRSFSAYILHSFYDKSNYQKLIMTDTDKPPLLNRFLMSFNIPYLHDYPGYENWKLVEMMKEDWKKDNFKLPYDFPYSTIHEWKTAYNRGEYIDFGDTWTQMKRKAGELHITNYGFQIDTVNNQRIKDFDKIVALASERNWRLVLHLLPENRDKTDSLMGKDLVWLIDYNRNLLHKRYNKNGLTIMDNLDELDEKDFINSDPNSHYYYNGRKILAEKLAVFLLE